MQNKDSWLLPEGIDEVLPEQAEYLETLRRKLLDTFATWGYQQVLPPFVDFLDSLLTGSGHDLNLQTFKLTDPLSGQILGVRADMTPQVARIDAQLFAVLQRKAGAELNELVNGFAINTESKQALIALAKLNGDRDILSKARALFGDKLPSLTQALDDLQQLADKLQRDFPALPVSFDLAELRGYHYHTGIVFAAFIPTIGREIARGGRYDNIGKIFGRARAASAPT